MTGTTSATPRERQTLDNDRDSKERNIEWQNAVLHAKRETGVKVGEGQLERKQSRVKQTGRQGTNSKPTR